MPFSFASLAFASVKLFYSQRLARFYNVDPSIKQVIFLLPFCSVQILANISVVILLASYFKGLSIAAVAILVSLQFVILRWSPVRKEIFPPVENLFKQNYREHLTMKVGDSALVVVV